MSDLQTGVGASTGVGDPLSGMGDPLTATARTALTMVKSFAENIMVRVDKGRVF
jgi:hypothetical protein